jgi:hypothetical protein
VDAFVAFSSGIIKPPIEFLVEGFAWSLLIFMLEEEEGTNKVLKMATIQVVATTSVTSALRIIFVLPLRVSFVSGVGSITGIVLVSDAILDSYRVAASEGIQYSVLSITCCRRRYRC